MTLISDALWRLDPKPDDFPPGEVWLAGAGPGGLENLTLGVLSALAQADAVVYDALVDPAVLKAARGDLHFVGKRAGRPSTSQADINALIVRLAREGKRVLRLKGGDPNIFGRGGEEALALETNRVPFRFLPGVTSGLAALSHVGIPATMRGVNKALILAAGHSAGDDGDLDWAALARAGQPIVVYMGLGRLPVIAAALRAGGMPADTPAAILAACFTPDERTIFATLDTIATRAAEKQVASPALVVIGDIVARRFGKAVP